MPVELDQHHLVVTKGSIGRLSGLNLLIDTGTIPSVVDGRIARKLHIQTESSIVVAFGRQVQTRSAVVDGFRIGSFSSGAVPVGVGDLCTWKASASMPSSGSTHWRGRTSASTIARAC